MRSRGDIVSFRLFVYYSAVCGAGGGLLGWAVGRLLSGVALLTSAFQGLALGLFIALAVVLVESAGQLALRQRGLTVQRLLSALVLGGSAGFLGGLCVHLLGRSQPAVGVLLGWTAAGLLIGASSGLFEWVLCIATGQDPRSPRRKTLQGLLAGAGGGLVGAGLALVCRLSWEGVFTAKPPERIWSPDAWGSALLGASIALAVSLMQVLTRQSWLQIEQGSRAGSEVLLVRPLLTLGRADHCDLGLQDSKLDKLHARLEQHGRRYLVIDAGSIGGTFVNGERLDGPHILRAGDLIQIGDSVLRFHERRGSVRGPE